MLNLVASYCLTEVAKPIRRSLHGNRRETSYLFWLADANGTTKLTLYERLGLDGGRWVMRAQRILGTLKVELLVFATWSGVADVCCKIVVYVLNGGYS